jgi:hypothetical protein
MDDIITFTDSGEQDPVNLGKVWNVGGYPKAVCLNAA